MLYQAHVKDVPGFRKKILLDGPVLHPVCTTTDKAKSTDSLVFPTQVRARLVAVHHIAKCSFKARALLLLAELLEGRDIHRILSMWAEL